MKPDGSRARGPLSRAVRRYPLAAFFALAYAITWAFSALATPGLLGIELPTAAPAGRFAVRGLGAVLWHFGPALAAILVTGALGGRAGLRELFGRLGAWRAGAGRYFFVLAYPLVARLLVVGLDVLCGGTPPVFFSARGVPDGHPLALFVPVLVGVLLQAGLAEEIGWRGFALPRLQAHYSPLISSLVLGLLWALWHFHPLNWPVMRPVALWYVIGTLPFTVLFTWVHNSTGGSLLLPVLFHTASNMSDWIVPIVPFLTATGGGRAYGWLILVNTLLAAIVVAGGSGRLALSTAVRARKDRP